MKRLLLVLFVVGPAVADDTASGILAAVGDVSEAEGLAAWSRIEAVVTHPRCANCHVGGDNIPMWSGSTFGESRPHGMNVQGGDSRMGAESVPCSSCHMTSTAANTTPHAAPHVGIPWQLAPVEFEWFGKSGTEICRQLRDPERNGGRDAEGLVEHLLHDAELDGFVPWGWVPGGGRDTPPGDFDQHVQDMATWGAAGLPCPG